MTPIFPQATSEPLSPERLAEIAERAAHLYEYALQTDEGDTLAGEDVPALLAEIERVTVERNNAVATVAEQAAKLAYRDRVLNAQREHIAELETGLNDLAALVSSWHKRAETAEARVAELERPAADGSRCYHGDVIGSGDCPGCDNEAATFREGWQRHDDPGRCLSAHAFRPRDGRRLICANCDHIKVAPCHTEAGES